MNHYQHLNYTLDKGKERTFYDKGWDGKGKNSCFTRTHAQVY
jgi:hypothetical protein